jgi:hypothetical protein
MGRHRASPVPFADRPAKYHSALPTSGFCGPGPSIDLVGHGLELVGKTTQRFGDLRGALSQFAQSLGLSPQESGMCCAIHSSQTTALANDGCRLQSSRLQFYFYFTDCYSVFKFG